MSITKKTEYVVGDRVEKLCLVCNEERGHIVALVSKRGLISRVSCPQCGTRSTFSSRATVQSSATVIKEGAIYDRNRTYRKGQTMMHPTFGPGEVTAVIEPRKIDVLFADRVRRLIHSCPQA
jgi:hypothetical protein